ncbi:MAG: hypothetical protein ACRC06_16235, partial [Waterburya sp.]
LIYDMTPPHEGMPHGVSTDYDWVSGPLVDTEMNTQDFKAMTAWGQLYEDSIGNSATNSRVQIKNIKAYMLSKQDDKWHLLQSSKKVEGAAYREDFAGDMSKPANIRYEQDGSVSVKAGQGYNFHFWPLNNRVSINREDIAAIFTTVQARLVIDNPQKPDDRSKARYLLGMGGDYWLTMTAQWDNWTTNGGIGVGKLKYVTTNWRNFNLITLSSSEIRRNPPPLCTEVMSSDKE